MSTASPGIPISAGNWIGGREVDALEGQWLTKMNPATGEPLCRAARSQRADVDRAVDSAVRAQPDWSDLPGVRRGEILLDIAIALRGERERIARIVAAETGKSLKAALGETDAAIALGTFMAGEGQRMYGRTTTSGILDRHVFTIRQPIGVAGLIVAANTPIANVAWKVFPALICGNAAVLKAAEDTPLTAIAFAEIAHAAGLPPGVLSVINGYGKEAGRSLVEDNRIGVISFTGSTAVGREIATVAASRLARVSLELGGKNPFVVCADADLANAVKWASLSAFSNAGQRCASGSRIIVMDAVYERFRDELVAATERLKIGVEDDDDFGPVINERQLTNILAAVEQARAEGAVILTGGQRLESSAHRSGYFMAPTVVEMVSADNDLSRTELFGPVASLYRASDFEAALSLANDSPFGLTACIHTSSIHRAFEFTSRIQAGVAVVNAGTFGSEAHLPFGGRKQSGNGSREPGTEALDVYSELKNVYITTDPRWV